MSEAKIISEEELKVIEAEVTSKQAEEFKKQSEVKAKEIESTIRKEYEEKTEKEKLSNQIKSQEEAIKKLQSETESKMKAQEEAFKKQLEELQAQKRGLVRSDSPFQNGTDPKNIKVIDGKEVDVTKLNMTDIEMQSAEAFRRHHNLPPWYFEKTGKEKR